MPRVHVNEPSPARLDYSSEKSRARALDRRRPCLSAGRHHLPQLRGALDLQNAPVTERGCGGLAERLPLGPQSDSPQPLRSLAIGQIQLIYVINW